jgi:hypothetical protein
MMPSVQRVSGWLVVAPIVLMSPALEAQEVATTVYLGGAPAPNGVTAALGARVDVFGAWGAYARAGLRGAANVCETSLPPTCDYPEGESYEFAAGLTYPAEGKGWVLLLGAGGGALSWQDGLDPFVDMSFEARRRLNGHMSLMLGLDAIYAPSVERKRNGNAAIVRERSVFFPAIMLGLSLNL